MCDEPSDISVWCLWFVSVLVDCGLIFVLFRLAQYLRWARLHLPSSYVGSNDGIIQSNKHSIPASVLVVILSEIYKNDSNCISF